MNVHFGGPAHLTIRMHIYTR